MTTEQYSIGYDAGYQDGFDAALAEPVKQEPVADNFVGVVTKESLDGVVKWKGWIPREGTKLYAAPVSAKREWVDLTDDEIAEFKDKALYREMSLSEFANAVIAAFKEKNK